MTTNLMAEAGWAPGACMLPTVERPLRQAEFDAVFLEDVTSIERSSISRTRFGLRPRPEVSQRVAALATKETGCCSFFAFDLVIAAGSVVLEVAVDEMHQDVLAALTARAETVLDGRP